MKRIIGILSVMLIVLTVSIDASATMKIKPPRVRNFEIVSYTYTLYKVNDMGKMLVRELDTIHQKDFLAFCDFDKDEIMIVEGFEMPEFYGVRIVDTIGIFTGYMVKFPDGTRRKLGDIAWNSERKDKHYYDNVPREAPVGDYMVAIKGDQIYYKNGVDYYDIVAMDKVFSKAKKTFEKNK